MSSYKPAILALEDGSIFRGRAFGSSATVSGECVFNTSMTGYQEILTDPSYFGQIVTMTAVQIGNYGINDADNEAATPKASGFVVRELSPVVSNWRSRLSLEDYLARHGIPGISEIDTRALARPRSRHALLLCLRRAITAGHQRHRRRHEQRQACLHLREPRNGVLVMFLNAQLVCVLYYCTSNLVHVHLGEFIF